MHSKFCWTSAARNSGLRRRPMPIVWKSKTLLLALCAVIAVMPTTGAARPFAIPDDQDKKPTKADTKDDSEEEPEDESAPAALEIDVSTSSPLIQELYQA